MEMTCENCMTKITLGCSQYRAEDCGQDMEEWTAMPLLGEVIAPMKIIEEDIKTIDDAITKIYWYDRYCDCDIIKNCDTCITRLEKRAVIINLEKLKEKLLGGL